MSFYFAWVDPTDTTFLPAFAREDEVILDFEVEQSEGDFATLDITIENPRTGLLATARKRWAWLARDNGSVVEPLFFGRLVGIPDGMDGEALRLTFRARPDDYADQKEAAAAALRVLPWFDPVWISADLRADPDMALEARSSMWHVDRVTHAVTTSDIITGEAGVIDISGAAFRDSVDWRFSHLPAARVDVTAEMTWKQAGAGTFDVSQTIADAFAAAGTSRGNLVSSYTGQGLVNDWPRAGTNIGAGWSVRSVRLSRLDGDLVPSEGKVANTDTYSRVYFPLWYLRPDMVLRFDAQRDRRETVTFSMAAGIQPVVAEASDAEAVAVTFSSSAAAEVIDGARPIGDLKRRSYFQTDRGRHSIHYLALVARARLLAQARCVEVLADIPFDLAVSLSCRHSATIADARLPGGTVTGKVVSYRFGLNGDAGEMSGAVTIAATVGAGGSLSADTPVPAYVEDGYVVDGVQGYSGGDEVLPSGDVALGHFDTIAIADDGVMFDQMDAGQAVLDCTIENGPSDQAAVLDTYHIDAAGAIAALEAAPTVVQLTLRPLDGLSFATDYALTTSDVIIPKTIDLEAA